MLRFCQKNTQRLKRDELQPSQLVPALLQGRHVVEGACPMSLSSCRYSTWRSYTAWVKILFALIITKLRPLLWGHALVCWVIWNSLALYLQSLMQGKWFVPCSFFITSSGRGFGFGPRFRFSTGSFSSSSSSPVSSSSLKSLSSSIILLMTSFSGSDTPVEDVDDARAVRLEPVHQSMKRKLNCW